MSGSATPLDLLAESFTEVIRDVDETIGENKTYGEGIGPHDEDDQIGALVDAVRAEGTFPGRLYTVKQSPSKTRYPGGQSADLVIETDDATVFCEAKLFRFQRANGNPSPQAFGKVFNPFQDRNPRSFIHDVAKLAESEVAARKGFLGIYYRPVSGAGTEITGREVAEKFRADVEQWMDYPLIVESVVQFDGLQHDVLNRGAVMAWSLDQEPEEWFQ